LENKVVDEMIKIRPEEVPKMETDPPAEEEDIETEAPLHDQFMQVLAQIRKYSGAGGRGRCGRR
jgi:hypothetical protein